MEWTEALTQNLFGLLAGLVGAIVGGAFTVYAAIKTIRLQDEKERRQEEKEIQNLLDALAVEVDALWDFHMHRIGGMVERLKAGDALEFHYPLTQDYFTVYNSNAGSIGKVKDPDLRKAIVVTYNKCKKVVDGFKYNNELFLHYRELRTIDAPHERTQAALIELQHYAQVIKEDHFELKGYVEDLLEKMDSRVH